MSATDTHIDGVYAGYMTGVEGNGFGMFVFLNGVIAGSDPLGVKFDGSYISSDEGHTATVLVTVPSGGTIIQGASAGPSGMTYEVCFNLPTHFTEQDYHRIETSLGPINVRLRHLRNLRF